MGLENRGKFPSRLIDLLLFRRHNTILAPFFGFHKVNPETSTPRLSYPEGSEILASILL